MELKWLEDFLSLANSGSFSRSASDRNVTQPAFSRRIKALEHWLGADMVDRSSYPTTLTAEGTAFRETAEEVLRLLHAARDEFRDQAHKSQLAISFAALHTLSLNFYPKWLRRVFDRIPPVTTRLQASDLHDSMQALTEGNCDFLLCYSHPWAPMLLDPSDYPSIRLGEERLVPVSRTQKDGSAEFTLPGTKKAPTPLLSYTAHCFLGKVMEAILQQSSEKYRLTTVYENSMAEALKAMVAEGYGIAWLPENSIRQELANGRLAIIGDATDAPVLEIRLYRARRRNRANVEKFWARALELAET